MDLRYCNPIVVQHGSRRTLMQNFVHLYSFLPKITFGQSRKQNFEPIMMESWRRETSLKVLSNQSQPRAQDWAFGNFNGGERLIFCACRCRVTMSMQLSTGTVHSMYVRHTVATSATKGMIGEPNRRTALRSPVLFRERSLPRLRSCQ